MNDGKRGEINALYRFKRQVKKVGIKCPFEDAAFWTLWIKVTKVMLRERFTARYILLHHATL